MSNTVTREQVRAMLRKMLPEFDLKFQDERVDASALDPHAVVELDSDDLIEEKDPGLSALDRLDRAAQLREGP